MTGPAWPAFALVAITPVVVDPSGYHRYVALRFGFVAVVVAVGVVLAVRDGVQVDRRLAAILGAATLVTAAAAILGPDPLLGLLGDPVRMMAVPTACLIVGGFVIGANAGEARAVSRGLLVGGAVVVVVGLADLATGSGRVTSTMGNAAFLGAFLCLLLPVAIARALTVRSVRSWPLAVAVGAVVVLAATGSRAAWIGAAAGVALLAGLRRRRVALLVAAVAVVAVLMALPFASRGTARGRVDTWRETVDVVGRRPALGWGPEGFRRGFGEEMSPAWVRRYSLDQIPDRAHNRFLDVAASSGLAGLTVDVAVIAVIAAAARRLLRSLEPASPRWWEAAGLVAGLGAWIVQGQFLFDTFDLAVIAAVLVGALVGRGQLRVRAAALVPAVAVGVAVVGLAAVNLYADRLVSSGSGKQPVVALDHLVRAAELRPRALDVHLLAAEVAIRSGDRDLLEDAHGLLRKWDDDLVRVADARVLAGLGHFDAAESLLRTVLRRQPANTRARDALSAVRRVAS